MERIRRVLRGAGARGLSAAAAAVQAHMPVVEAYAALTRLEQAGEAERWVPRPADALVYWRSKEPGDFHAT